MPVVVRLGGLVRDNLFLSIAVVATGVSCVFVPPDADYLHYFDYRTLVCLFCMLAVICALERVHVFTMLAEQVVRVLRTRRALIFGLVSVTLLGSMLISNDMSLLTFLPLSYVALKATDNEKYVAFVFIMETAAANLGGMITPFGSPQNLYLYQHFHIGVAQFLATMAVPFVASLTLIFATCALVPSAPVAPVALTSSVPVRTSLLYAALFVTAIAIVLRILPVWCGGLVVVALLIADRAAVAAVDYGLMLTFVVFFIFSGNVSRMSGLGGAVGHLLAANPLVVSALGSQLISNVPAAILGSQFTDHYRQLLVGVNIGGVGTLVASLASLITLRKYRAYQPGGIRRYLVLFSVVNFGLLAALLILMQFVFPAGS